MLCGGLIALGALGGCVSLGPDGARPEAEAPASWPERHTGSPQLTAGLAVDTVPAPRPELWWQVFGDPTLDELQRRVRAASPELRTAALRFAQSRALRSVAASGVMPRVDLQGQIARQRQSEHGPETRLVEAIGGPGSQALIALLSDPFTLYQAGFDASWELDLWGGVRRSIEAADANVAAAAARVEDAQLALSAELARAWFELRQLQGQQALLARDVAIARELLTLQQARADGGLVAQDAVLELRQRLAQLEARIAPLEARRAAVANQIALLAGEAPGGLDDVLSAAAVAPIDTASATPAEPAPLPDLALGLPAEVVRRRPDIRAAEARLQAATAQIGVAMADLYPRIALGARAGLQSIESGSFGDWGARTWQVGPVLSLPLFDRGRRRATVELRRLQQQEAAVDWHRQVLVAWREVDDALNAFAAERSVNARLHESEAVLREKLMLAVARREGGLTSEFLPLQAELEWRTLQEELAASEARLRTALAAVYKATGG